MVSSFEPIYTTVCAWARSKDISVRSTVLGPNKAGEFDGVSATMNSSYSAEERTYYLVHALGSIVRWSLSRAAVQEMFQELRAAKKTREQDPARLESAIDRYRAFEIESSEFAVWLLAELGHRNAISSFTNFMRADLEALTQFHHQGVAPVWRDFFARWNEDIRLGRRTVDEYQPKPIPNFEPRQIDKQEILQEQPK